TPPAAARPASPGKTSCNPGRDDNRGERADSPRAWFVLTMRSEDGSQRLPDFQLHLDERAVQPTLQDDAISGIRQLGQQLFRGGVFRQPYSNHVGSSLK